jgi:hypothetical protein
MINPVYNGSDTGGMAYPKHRGLAVNRHRDDEWLGYAIAHEMGHCFHFDHAPSPRAETPPILGIPTNVIDYGYPYGGSGMAGGWGYTNIRLSSDSPDPHKIKRVFLSEDSHTVENNLKAHWDVMAYLSSDKSRAHDTNRFSDYFAAQLKTAQAIADPPAPEGGGLAELDIILGSSVKVFGPRAAYYTEQMLSDLTGGESRAEDDLLDGGGANLGSVVLDYTISPSDLTGDPDGDGTGLPSIIVTRVPRVKGLTLSENPVYMD